jgi:uncharacterized protein (TIGR02391 family)
VEEAVRLAGRLRAELVPRGTHPEVLRYCEEELVRRSIFHAVFEATKGLAARLRQLSGSMLDESELVNHCFGVKGGTTPVLRINGYQNKSEESEHRSFANLLYGIFGRSATRLHTPSGSSGVDDHQVRRLGPVLDAVVPALMPLWMSSS